jgi:CheY-like chemotaxis protein
MSVFEQEQPSKTSSPNPAPPPSSSSSNPQISLTSNNLQMFIDDNPVELQICHSQETELMGNHLLKLASDLRSLLQQFFHKRLATRKFDEFAQDDSSFPPPSEQQLQQQQQQQGNDDWGWEENLFEEELNPQPRKKQRLREASPSGSASGRSSAAASSPTASEEEEEDTAVYETAVVRYRSLRNEIPLLTDAAHDIEAATVGGMEGHKTNRSLNGFPLYPNLSLGPLVKRAPPGRGRRKTLSVINTPLPATILETLHKQKKNSNPDLLASSNSELIFPRPFRILFIDDSVITLKLTAKRLQDAGFWIETTTSGVDALQLIYGKNDSNGEHDGYDIVLTDLNMPIMSGAEVTPHLSPLALLVSRTHPPDFSPLPPYLRWPLHYGNMKQLPNETVESRKDNSSLVLLVTLEVIFLTQLLLLEWMSSLPNHSPLLISNSLSNRIPNQHPNPPLPMRRLIPMKTSQIFLKNYFSNDKGMQLIS